MHILALTFRSLFAGVCLFVTISKAQWSADPNINLAVCDTSGSQELPKIGLTSDGGCYVSWFDTRAGAYRVYMQRLNAQGVKQWGTTGLLISANPQSTSLVDWDLAVDDSNNAIVVFTDTRNGSSINPFAYKISSQGDFRWGSNGVQLSNATTVFQADPKVAKTSDGGFVFVWQYGSSPNQVAIQKLNAAGIKQWGTDPILISGGAEHRWRPSVVASDGGTAILLYAGFTGTPNSPQNYKLLSQKVSSTGTTMWADTVYSLGRVPGFFVPKIFSDGNNGAFYVWHDERGGANSTSYVQHFTSTADKLFPINGTASSTLAGRLHNDAWIAYTPLNGETYMFWYETNSSLQNVFGVYGQKFSSTGARMWPDSGVAFKPLADSAQPSFIKAFAMNSSAVVYYLQLVSGTTRVVKGFMTDRNGNLLWGGTIRDVSSLASGKGRLTGALTTDGTSLLAWSDNRVDGNGVYGQNANFDGTLGNPPPPPSWVTQTSGVATALYSVKAVDQNIAWTAGAGGRALKTVNTGNTWTSVGGGRIGTADIYAIEALRETAFVTITPSTITYILRTTNGGATWDTVFSQVGGFIDAIKMFSNTSVLAVGDPVGGRWTIVRTTNCGETWTLDPNAPPQIGTEAGSNNGLCALSENWILFPSNSAPPKVYRTTNGGSNWSSTVLPLSDPFVAGIAFNGPVYGVVGGNAGSAARTSDGGATWTSTTIPGTGAVYSISVSGLDFFATKGTNVYRSTDRGATWTLSWTGTIGTLEHCSFTGSSSTARGWVVSSVGGIATYWGGGGDAVEDPDTENLNGYALTQNYPNPFNPTTTLRYALPRDAKVTLSIYNILGQRIATLKDEIQSVGYHDVVWDGRNDLDSQVSSGVYFYRIEVGSVDGSHAFTSIKKMMFLK